jgi:hypothetical protein
MPAKKIGKRLMIDLLARHQLRGRQNLVVIGHGAPPELTSCVLPDYESHAPTLSAR